MTALFAHTVPCIYFCHSTSDILLHFFVIYLFLPLTTGSSEPYPSLLPSTWQSSSGTKPAANTRRIKFFKSLLTKISSRYYEVKHQYISICSNSTFIKFRQKCRHQHGRRVSSGRQGCPWQDSRGKVQGKDCGSVPSLAAHQNCCIKKVPACEPTPNQQNPNI